MTKFQSYFNIELRIGEFCMKKFLITLSVLLVGLGASAEFVELETNVNMANFWDKNGKDVQKITEVGSRIINANQLDKHVAIVRKRNLNTINAEAHYLDKTVYVYTGILPYFDNDDECAYVLSHEIAHCLDYYDGPLKVISMTFNGKEYETKADLVGIDLMAKAGYNPIAAITTTKKISGEYVLGNWIFFSHPKASVRMMNMYKYIYKKYPSYLNSEMAHNINYQNFTYSCEKEINEFKRNEKNRATKIEDL